MLTVITLKVSLFIFFLVLAFVAGAVVIGFAAVSAINASYKEPADRNELRVEFRNTLASKSTLVE